MAEPRVEHVRKDIPASGAEHAIAGRLRALEHETRKRHGNEHPGCERNQSRDALPCLLARISEARGEGDRAADRTQYERSNERKRTIQNVTTVDCVVSPLSTTAIAPEGLPTENAKAPCKGWPSSETARHATVYVPFARCPVIGTASVPGEGVFTPPVATCSAFGPNTRTEPSDRWNGLAETKRYLRRGRRDDGAVGRRRREKLRVSGCSRRCDERNCARRDHRREPYPASEHYWHRLPPPRDSGRAWSAARAA